MSKTNTIADVVSVLNQFAPLAYQESYDNSGLQVGYPNHVVSGILICLDITEAVVEEAITLGCNLIVSHHPLIFKGVKSLTGANYVERCVMKALRHDIAIYAGHTNVDSVRGGVSFRLAQKLGLQQVRVLMPQTKGMTKLVTFVPHEHVDKVCEALYHCGAGRQGNYDHCSYRVEGEGSFRPLVGSNPFVGKVGEEHHEKEIRLEFILPNYLTNRCVKALQEAHPYEEPAYDVIALENADENAGLGVVGELKEAVDSAEFLQFVKEELALPCLKHSPLVKNKIKRVALCGGSGGDFVNAAKQCDADIYITGEMSYHRFFEHENRLIMAEIGHYESEQFTKEIFYEQLIEKFSNFAIRISQAEVVPVCVL